MKSRRIITLGIATLLVIVCSSTAFVHAHPGRTDANGGHHVTATGEYHYHHGYPSHQHPGGVCPYDNKVLKGENSVSSSKNNNTYSHPSKQESGIEGYLVLVIICGIGLFSFSVKKSDFNEPPKSNGNGCTSENKKSI